MVWYTTIDGKYRIESISAANFPGAIQVTREGCIPHETTCIGTGVNKDPLAVEEMLELCADAALDGLSLVAVATDTEEVVASVFCKLQEAPTPGSTEKSFFEVFKEERCKRPASRNMMEFKIEIDEKCNYFERYGVDCCCEIMFLGTLPQHRLKGLAKLLVKTAVELAEKFKDRPIAPLTIAELGPKYAFMKPRKPVTKAPQLCTALWSAMPSKRIGVILGFNIAVGLDVIPRLYTHGGGRPPWQQNTWGLHMQTDELFRTDKKLFYKVMEDHFFRDEPVGNGTDVNKNPLAGEELLELCADAALDCLLLVAVAVESGVVLAVFQTTKTTSLFIGYGVECWCELMFPGDSPSTQKQRAWQIVM